jgi:hypothetical protein
MSVYMFMPYLYVFTILLIFSFFGANAPFFFENILKIDFQMHGGCEIYDYKSIF